MDLSLSLLLIRFTVGLVIMAHGAQKLVGIGGGPGLRGWTANVGKMGFQPAPFWGLVSVSTEFLGGTALAVGFFTPVAAAFIVAQMFVAIVKAHWQRGFWVSNGGLEYAFVLGIVSAAIGLGGPGRYSVDATLGRPQRSGLRAPRRAGTDRRCVDDPERGDPRAGPDRAGVEGADQGRGLTQPRSGSSTTKRTDLDADS